jgi:hypothetical protein
LNNCHLDISDDGLYRHFLEHAPKFVQGGPRSIVAVQNILSLATQSGCGAIYRSLLALSAACLCCDLIVNNELNLESVRQVLSKGLQHHNYALEQMRSMISRPEENNAECIVSNCIWLFPFAFAFQSINHWLQCRTDSGLDPHSVNPRDAIMLLRGLQATLSVQYDKTKCSHFHQPTNSAPIVLKSSDELTGLSRKHPMFPIITATSHHAFDQLEQRIRLAQFSLEYDDVQLLFCEKAFDILNGLRISIFTSSEAILDAAKYNDNDKYKGPESLRMNIPDWLQAYAMRKPTPSDETEPLSRTLFHFFHVVPQGYLDILFPLLEKDSELAGHDTSQQTVAQYLAIEIYAYWLVLLLLIEQEAWWVGSFPAIGLQGLIKNYGAHLLNNSDFGKKQIKVKWWPKSMFEVMTNIKDWK